jgi:hypothetical protein
MPEHGGRRLVAVFAIAFVALAVGAGLVVLPSRARAMQLDRERVRDLRDISGALENYVEKRGTLPQSLSELAKEPWTPVRVSDPSTGEPYRYRVIDENLCEVCATFERASDDDRGATQVNFWAHEAGEKCFQLRPSRRERASGPA